MGVMAECGYTMEELVPLVGKLAGRYAGYESSSVSYEKAQQLMEAVIYCICEAQKASEANRTEVLHTGTGAKSAERDYQIGLDKVKEKVNRALQLFNRITDNFYFAGNQVLADTVLKGMPAFFKWYDIEYAPQDTILTLDYPVLRDLTGYCGVDAIYEYLRCIELEQYFLKHSDSKLTAQALARRGFGDPEQVGNLCEAVLEDMIYTSLQGRKMAEQERNRLGDQILEHLQKTFAQTELTEYLKTAINDILHRYACMTE